VTRMIPNKGNKVLLITIMAVKLEYETYQEEYHNSGLLMSLYVLNSGNDIHSVMHSPSLTSLEN